MRVSEATSLVSLVSGSLHICVKMLILINRTPNMLNDHYEGLWSLKVHIWEKESRENGMNMSEMEWKLTLIYRSIDSII